MLGEGFANGLSTLEGRDLRGLLHPDRILGGVAHQFLELQLQLVDEPGRPLGTVAVSLAA